MRKKGWLVIPALLMVFLTACGNDDAQPVDNLSVSSAEAETVSAPPESEGRTLVAVFSWANNVGEAKGDEVTGDTLVLADEAVEVTGGTRYDIVRAEPYPTKEADVYEEAKAEQLAQARPALAEEVANMDDYSTIVLLYPNWLGSVPMPVATFLTSYDFSHKTLVPVCCYDAEDSGAGTSYEDIAALCDAYVTKGYTVRGRAVVTSGTQVDFENWLKDLSVAF